jgi:hypothetical protein
MAFDSGANHQDRNVPIQSDGIVPKDEYYYEDTQQVRLFEKQFGEEFS